MLKTGCLMSLVFLAMSANNDVQWPLLWSVSPALIASSLWLVGAFMKGILP